MNRVAFFKLFETLADTPEAVEKLRKLVLDFAIRGRLVRQNHEEEPATELAERVSALGKRIAKEQKLKLPSPERGIEEGKQSFRLPEGWVWVKLGDLCIKLGAGSTPLGGKQVYQTSGIKFLRSQNIWNEGLHLDDVALITPAVHKAMAATHVQAGDVLLNITGASIGRCAVVPDDFDEANVSQHVAIIRLADKTIRRFIHLIIIASDFQSQIMQVQVGVSREGLSMKNLKEFVVALPPLAEQWRIVAKVEELLALCDELEARQTSAREHRTRLVRSALDHLTTAKDESDFRKRSAFVLQHSDMVLDSVPADFRKSILTLAFQGKLVPQDVNDEIVEKLPNVPVKAERKKAKWAGPIEEQEEPFHLPPSWTWFRLGDISCLKHGYAFSSEFFTIEPAPFVLTTPGNFYEKGGFRDRESKRKYYSGPVDPEFIFKPGDLIIPMTEQAEGLLGSPAFIPDDGRVYIHNQRLGKVSFSKAIAPEFAFWFFNCEFFRRELARTCTGMKVRHTSPDRILRVPFPVCPLAEQKRIVAKVDELMRSCDALEARLTAAETAGEHLLDVTLYRLLAT